MNSHSDSDILNFLKTEGIIDVDNVQNCMKKKEKQKYLSQHKYKITFAEKEGRWRTTVPDASRPNGRRSIAKATREALENEIIAFYAALDAETNRREDLSTLEKIFPIWLKYKDTQTNASSYTRRILNDWNKYYKNTKIAKMHVRNLTYHTLNIWAHQLIKEYHLTKKQYYNLTLIIRGCLDYVCESDINLLTDNPFQRVKVNKKLFTKADKPKSNTQVFLTDEQTAIAEMAQKKFNEHPYCITPLMILLNFQIGLRIGELCAIKWEDIEGNYINIQRMEVTGYNLDENAQVKYAGLRIANYTKSEAGNRPVYLNNTAKGILTLIKNVHLQYGYYDDGFIYIGCNTKTRGTHSAFSRYLTDLCISSGVVPKSSHKIRKTYISSLFDAGININTIREQAGHVDERTSLNNYCFDQNVDTVIESKLENAANNIAFIKSVNNCEQII